MKREQIMDTIKSLAHCQGTYSRLYANMCELRDNDPDRFDECMTELENQNFKDAVDLVLFIEN